MSPSGAKMALTVPSLLLCVGQGHGETKFLYEITHRTGRAIQS